MFSTRSVGMSLARRLNAGNSRSEYSRRVGHLKLESRFNRRYATKIAVI